VTGTALLLRPEPGNAATRARLAAAGIAAVALPLFRVGPLPWRVPDGGGHDAVVFTSANAARLGGDGLAALRHLPALAVGRATARAARDAGFQVAITGDADAAALLLAARAAGFAHPLHLAGRDHRPSGAATVAVYASTAVAVSPAALADAVQGTGAVLLHSPRAARRFAGLVADSSVRATLALAAISPATMAAAGSGWGWAAAATSPDDAALVALVRQRLTGPPGAGISTA